MRAIIFNLDGVIINSEKFNFKIINEILSQNKYPFSEEEYIEQFLGQKIKFAMKEFLGRDANKAQTIVKKCIELKRNLLLTNARKEISVREGIIDCIKRLYRDFPLGLYSSSSKEFTKIILREFNLGFYFNEITFGEEIRNPKPKPEGYLINAQKMRMSPHNCIAIDYSEIGVEAAIEAGMKCLAVPNDFTKKQNLIQANMVLKSFKDITPELINKLLI